MVDSETFNRVLTTKPGVARTHVSPPGSSLQADGDPSVAEIEVEFTPDATAEEYDVVRETAKQNGWQVTTEWGTDAWLLEKHP